MAERVTEPEVTRTRKKVAPEPAEPARPAAPSQDAGLLALQRAAGNAAVVSLLTEAPVQTKLTVGPADDVHEQEADRVADEVLRLLSGSEEKASEDDSEDDGSGSGRGGRQTSTGGGDDEAARKPAPRIRRAAAAGGPSAAAASPGHGLAGGPVEEGVARQIEQSRGGGQALDADVRARMESGFGADFSAVRIHTGSQADALSRSLNAKAFTTGSDIFFSNGAAGDDRILAHELAHTVQQGSAVRAVRRFVSPAEFAAMTNQGTFTMKGTAQKKIEKYLGEYYALTGRKADAATYARPVIPDVKLKAALNLLELMHLTADGWLNAHSTKNDDGSRGDVELNRAKRGAGMVEFDKAVQAEKARLEAQLATKAASAKKQDDAAIEATKFDARADKIKKKFTGSLIDGFSLASTAIGALVTHDGQSTDFVLDITIPVGGPGYVAITLEFNVRKETNIELGVDLKVGAGAKVPNVADVRAAIGGFVKSSGKDARAAVDLAKYGIYRRLRESKAVPRELANKLWGDDSGQAGYQQSEKWSNQVEERHLAHEGAFVETGGAVAGKVHLGADAAGGGVEAQYQSGKRHDKQSVEAAKGSLGAANTRAGGGAADGSARGAQASTGRAVENIRLAGEINAGPFKGQMILDWSYRAPDPATKKTDFSSIEFQLNARLSLPIADLASTIVSLVGNLVTTVKGKAQTLAKQAQQQAKKKSGLDTTKEALGYAVPVLLTGNNIANAVAFDQAGVPWTKWAAGISREEAATKAASPTAAKLLSKVGLEIGVRLGADVDGKETGLLELRHVSDLDAALPELLKVQLVRKTRLGAAKWNGSAWVPAA